MPLPAPDLDDRRFQDLVDDAKRMVQRQCPEWTDHNVHDPGVVLIETFAYMVDQLIYRLNRVPDRLYLKFLDLLGVRLFPPTAARTDVTFWLTAPRDATLRIPGGTQVATERASATDTVISFATVKDLDVVTATLHRVMSSVADDQYRNHTEERGFTAFDCFDNPPKPGDALLIGLEEPVPSCILSMRLTCRIEGIGVDPTNPPVAWEAWCGESWERCEVAKDETGGMNQPGEVVILVPAEHTASVLARQRAAWVRCRVLEAEEGQPQYSASPRIEAVEVATIGGTVEAVNATEVTGEVLGTSAGIAGQRFTVTQAPIVPGDQPIVIETSDGDSDGDWITWEARDDFAASGPSDRHVVIDPTAGEIVFGPAVRLSDGTVEQHGAIPDKGAQIRIASYRTGGGTAGNVAPGALTVLKSSVQYIGRVENRRPARGGVDGESVEEAKARGPLALRTQGRAVTREDYEQLAQSAAPEVARVRCLEVNDPNGTAGVRVLVVPSAIDGELGALQIEQLIPEEESLVRISDTLDERRPIGARVIVEPPVYMGVTVVARVRARPGVQPARLQAAAVEALNRYFHPISGGPDGEGWPFGRPVLAGEVFGVLQQIKGTELVEDVRLFAADVLEGTRGQATTRIDLASNALVLSYNHQVLVEGG